MRCLTTILAVLALGTLPIAGQPGGKTSGSQLIGPLTSAPLFITYSEDGAADATVTDNPAPGSQGHRRVGAGRPAAYCPS
jgi:hypothetical protein